MKITCQQLISRLIQITKDNMQRAEELQILSLERLNKRQSDKSWSVLECLAHLNLYGDFYHPEIRCCMSKSNLQNDRYFKPGILGDYFAKSMLPKKRLNKMKTFKKMNPIHASLDKQVIHDFLKQQQDLLQLLELAKEKNLNQIKTSISISKWIKLKLGDTFRIVIFHNLRHMEQVKRILEI